MQYIIQSNNNWCACDGDAHILVSHGAILNDTTYHCSNTTHIFAIYGAIVNATHMTSPFF